MVYGRRMKGFTKDGKFRPTEKSTRLTSEQLGITDKNKKLNFGADAELKRISKMRGFFRYETGSYWDALTQKQRNAFADKAIGDRVGLKAYSRLLHSKFELIDQTNQKRLMNHFKEFHGY